MTRLKQFLLSLVNATLVLGIILVVLALVLLNQAESFTANVISDVKLGLLEEIDTDIKDVVGSIRSTEEELRVVANRLKQIVDQPEITLAVNDSAWLRSTSARTTRMMPSTRVAFTRERRNCLSRVMGACLSRVRPMGSDRRARRGNFSARRSRRP